MEDTSITKHFQVLPEGWSHVLERHLLIPLSPEGFTSHSWLWFTLTRVPPTFWNTHIENTMLSLLLFKAELLLYRYLIGRGWWCNGSERTASKYLFQMTMIIYHVDPYLLNILVYELSIFLRLSFLCSWHISSSMLFALPHSLDASTHYIHKCNQFYKASGGESRALGKLALQRDTTCREESRKQFILFQKFPAVFFCRIQKPGENRRTAGDQLEHASSWLLFHHTLRLPPI